MECLKSVMGCAAILVCMHAFCGYVSDAEVARKVALSFMFEDDWKLGDAVF